MCVTIQNNQKKKIFFLVMRLRSIFLASFFFFFAEPHGLCDLNSLTRDRTLGPQQWNDGVLTTGPPGNSLLAIFKYTVQY